MKKIIFAFAFILCSFSLFAQDFPDWVSDIAIEGNLRSAVKRLNINTDDFFVFPLENKVNAGDNFDLRKYAIISAFRDMVEPTVKQQIGLRLNEAGEVINRTIKSDLGFTTFTYIEDGKLKYSEIFEDKERGLIFPLYDADEEGARVVHGDCLNDILICLKKNPLFSKLKLEAEYYVYTETPEVKNDWLFGKLIIPEKKNNPVIVDKGTKSTTDKKYTECTGYFIFSLPKTEFSPKSQVLLEPVKK